MTSLIDQARHGLRVWSKVSSASVAGLLHRSDLYENAQYVDAAVGDYSLSVLTSVPDGPEPVRSWGE